MKRRLEVSLLLLLAGIASATPARAQCLETIVRSIADDYRQANAWPYPYVCPDRQAVVAPFEIMIDNGWRRQNLVADQHFKGKKGELSPGGERMIRWIVQEAPRHHRTIFVRRADTEEETAARVAAVQHFAAKVSTDGNVPQVLETTVSPAGHPADWPNPRDSSISRKYPITVPNNYLPHGESQQQ